jgi:phospholipase/carboxylesterase
LAEPLKLQFLERPPAGEPRGLLVLHHGRGTDERDLLPLADALDPQRSWHVVTPRAPLQPPGSEGYHWYLVPRVGTPDPATFRAARAALASFHDELWQRTGVEPARTVLGGFSMGAVMSYALGLDPERPVPAGILAFSGFIPAVEGWEPDVAGRTGLPVLIAHGRRDQVIDVGFGRAARDRLSAGGLEVEYHESDAAHGIDGAGLRAAAEWLVQRPAGFRGHDAGAEERGSA